MINYAVRTSGLSYNFSKTNRILDNICLEVPAAAIYGFLGPNGAGKTTTLRLLLGLLRKQQGAITMLGKAFDQHRVEILQNTGSLIESPSLYGHLTAVENLQVLQKIYQCNKLRIPLVLEIVGLQDAANKKASQFSLGMKQRLSIAIALLHNPQLLILDEPTNGLDPNGMIEMRELLKKLNREEGTTIIISSHLLSEIEKLVSHIGIISKGRMVFQGTLEALKAKQTEAGAVVFETDETETAERILLSNGYLPVVSGSMLKIPVVTKQTIAAINRELVNNGISVFGIHSGSYDLETIFMNLINN